MLGRQATLTNSFGTLWSSRAQTTGRFIRKPSHQCPNKHGCERRILDDDVVQEVEELKHVPAPVLPSKAEVEAHNVSHLPFRSWCSACVRGRGLSFGHRKVDTKTKVAEQIPAVSVDYRFFGQQEDRAHDTLSSAHRARLQEQMQLESSGAVIGVTHPYPARAPMTEELDFIRSKRLILKSGQERSIVALCDAVKNGWHGEIVPEASPMGES